VEDLQGGDEEDPPAANASVDELEEVNMKAKLVKEYMRTPCGHGYHSVCLNKWIEIRLECPTCR